MPAPPHLQRLVDIGLRGSDSEAIAAIRELISRVLGKPNEKVAHTVEIP